MTEFVWHRIRGDSLAARVALVLAVGMSMAVIGALLVAEEVNIRNLQRARLEGVVASTVDIADRLAQDPGPVGDLLHKDLIFGAHEAPASWGAVVPDADISRMLRARLGPASAAEAMLQNKRACLANMNLNMSTRVAGISDAHLPDCWYVRFRDANGVERRLAVDRQPMDIPPSSTLNPLYLLLIVGASALLSVLVTRLVTAPLRRLTAAARTFSLSTDPEPIPRHGPREVRMALETFNLMQQRVRRGVSERTQILAAITHDLQTPLTRLRLRLEEVENEPLRMRLIQDLAATQKLVRAGLDLAHSTESREPWSVVDIDSILSSIAEDCAEFGSDVRFIRGCNAHARVKPNALTRCLGNLVENAIKYAGQAELDCEYDDRALVIRVRDHGPGIPEHLIEKAFEPYSRLDDKGKLSPSGTGLGLTIARAQAQSFGAALTLRNHAEGGLLALLRLAP